MNTMDLLSLKVKEVMSVELFTASEDTVLKEINSIFERENIHHIPVVTEDSIFKGMISKSDILLLMDWGTKLNLPASLRKNTFLLTSNLAKDVMETKVISVARMIISGNAFRFSEKTISGLCRYWMNMTI